MHTRFRRLIVVCLAMVIAGGIVSVDAAEDGILPPLLTTTTQPQPTTTTTVDDSDDDGDDDDGDDEPESTPAPEGSEGGDHGDGTSPPDGTIVVPPEAQRIIDSVQRSGPSDTQDLWDALSQLEEVGLEPEEARKVGLGRFPIAGPANYTHDWLYPRYGPGFRFHLGTDVFAAHGTPVRAPADGTATSGTNELGGLAVKVHLDDGTYFYMAHLSGLAEGFTEGMEVTTGDIVGYVGDSGNAVGGSPHVHFGVHPQGGAAVDPKPILDGWADEARQRLPELVEHYRAQRQQAPAAPTDRGLLATELLRPLTSRQDPPALLSTDVLFASSANPAGGAFQLATDEAEAVAASIDWDARRASEEARQRALAGARQLLGLALDPFG